jgi:hypothetical protein
MVQNCSKTLACYHHYTLPNLGIDFVVSLQRPAGGALRETKNWGHVRWCQPCPGPERGIIQTRLITQISLLRPYPRHLLFP